MSPADEAQWILADAATSGVVRFATMLPGEAAVQNVKTLQNENYPTFTDALLAYVGQTGVSLKGSEFAMAVAAPPTGDAIPIARTRWTISRSGLGSIFGRPATIINDVATAAWVLIGPHARSIEPVGTRPAPRIEGGGRWAVVLLDDGVGTAAVMRAANGTCTVVDSEAGQSGFSPAGEQEFALMRAAGSRGHFSWEQALLTCGGPVGGRPSDGDLWARVAGSFVGDVVLQLGAWSGVIVTGRSATLLRDARRQAIFTERVQAKGRYGRQLAALPIGLVTHCDQLAGLQTLMAARHSGSTRP